MARYVALLRAVNVGGTGKLPMATLRAGLEAAGFGAVRTLLASGNVVFEAATTTTARLEGRVEGVLEAAAGLRTDIMVRGRAAWSAMLGANPYAEEADRAPAKMGLMIMKSGPDEGALKGYLGAYEGRERVVAGDGCIYLYFPDGMGQSKLKLPRSVGAGTVRNWNTCRKIAALLDEN